MDRKQTENVYEHIRTLAELVKGLSKNMLTFSERMIQLKKIVDVLSWGVFINGVSLLVIVWVIVSG